jgi:peroxiredoxin
MRDDGSWSRITWRRRDRVKADVNGEHGKTRSMRTTVAIPLLLSSLVACTKDPSPTPPGTNGAGTPPAVAAVASAPPQTTMAKAEIGKPAPDFTLKDLDGKDVSLSATRGKIVVLEWFNPGCPFVKKAHTKGSLVGLAKRHASDGIVWMAVNSGAPGKQGNELAMNVDAAKKFGLEHPILRDESGAIGHAYGATNTPHMFVIDQDGTLVYAGAIDNSPDGEAESPSDGKLVNYVDAALADLAAKRPVALPTTRAYGCSVKYGS